MAVTRLGIIGCGNIADAYLKGASRSSLVEVKGVADLRHEAAVARAGTYGVEAMSIDGMLADPEISIIVNITVPLAHADVSRSILEAGKHVYSEKPLAADFEAGRSVVELASRHGLRIGCAPDTFLGGGHQAARRVIDEGRIGKVVSGAACFTSHGMEMWHPNPEFFFKRGGGPILDMGPYYITQLVNLLGPVRRVTAQTSKAFDVRTVTSEPLRGTKIPVDVQTTVNGVLEFVNGANIPITTSWDIWKTERKPIEIYGERGSMLVPDPNFFGGDVLVSKEGGDWQPVDIGDHPFCKPNRELRQGKMAADYRMIGLIDMACAISAGRAHRASGDLALHVLEVMTAFDRSSAEGRHIEMTTTCEQPQPVPLGEDEEVFK